MSKYTYNPLLNLKLDQDTYKGSTHFISGLIEFGVNKEYVLDLNAKLPYTINEISIKTLSGTATADITIDAVSITGLGAIAVTSTEQTVAATALNAIAVGETLSMTLSATAFTEDVSFTIKYTI